MAGKRGVGSVRKLPSGRWQARVTGPDLMRHNAPTTFTTKRDAEAWIVTESKRMEDVDTWQPAQARLAAAAAERARAEAERILFADYAKHFLRTRTTKGKPLAQSTILRHQSTLKGHVLPAFGDLDLDSITPQRVLKWWEALPESPKIRREAYSLAKAIMSEAVSVHGPIPGHMNPFAIRGAGSGQSPKREETVSSEELRTILATMRPEWRCAVLLATWCGLRYGEIAELRRSDVDLTRRVIHVRRALALAGRKERHVKRPKSEAGNRNQRIPTSIVPDLKEHLASIMTGRDGLLFPNRTGGHLNPSVFYGKAKGGGKPSPGSWMAARAAAGRNDLHFHDLRATGATLMAQNGATVAEVQAWLGDSTPTAALRYVRATDSRMDTLTGRLSELASNGKW